MMEFQVPPSKPMGIILVSSSKTCLLCGSTLQLIKDRSAPLVVHDDVMGTIPASHYHKYCTNRTCKLTQYYGYHTIDGLTQIGSNFLSLYHLVKLLFL